jgi:hypothetical protein
MQERPAQGVPADGLQDGTAKKPLGETFLTRHRYPGVAAEASPPPAPAAPPTPNSRVFTRVVLPVALFVLAIGVIAWVVQYLPGRAAPPPPNTGTSANDKTRTRLTLKFEDPYLLADWEPERTKPYRDQWQKEGKLDAPPPPMLYAAEYEVSTDKHQDGGHYDFVFVNPNEEPVAVGVESMTCQCTSVEGCAFSEQEWDHYQKLRAAKGPVERSRLSPKDGFPWKGLVVGDTAGLVVPAKAHGAVRVFWVGRGKKEPESVRLGVDLWLSPPGKWDERQHTKLSLGIAYVHPVRFSTKRLDVGTISPQTATLPAAIYCWSATRDNLQVKVSNADPCFVYQVTPLKTAEERQKLTDELRGQGTMTRVRSACRIDVVVYESMKDQQLDLGSFTRDVPVEITADGDAVTPTPPEIHGRVQGDIKVATIEDKGVIDLKVFRADSSNSFKAKLWAKPQAKLEYVGFTPPGLKLKDVELKKRPADNVGDWVGWEIRFTVPPVLEPGALPGDSAILLREQATKRQLRIPLHGTASR